MRSRRAQGGEQEARWEAVKNRDSTADGSFFYSVRTTGVYCRPSCGARTPRRENVEFHASAEAAERAGYRACRRCRPNEPPQAERRAAIVAGLCRHIDSSEAMPALAELAAHAGMSVYHLHRLFKAATGLTPRAYHAARRAERAREELRMSSSVTEAIFASGYGSSGRFYEGASQVLGMKPSVWREGGKDEVIRFAIGECSLGSILVASTQRGVCAILLGDDPQELAHDLERRFPRAQLIGGDAGFEELVARVVGFVEQPRIGLELPLDIRGTAFQQRVWQALRGIPAGKTLTYAQIAIGAPEAVRAVAGACAANTIAVAIPCHRVVRKDGLLSGYRWGVERKRELLRREGGSQAGGSPEAEGPAVLLERG